MKLIDMKTLFITEVGSRMWGMEEFASDYDYFEVYQVDTKDILKGYRIKETLPHRIYEKDDKLIDHQSMEIGHLINLLCKGNINAIWGVTSPIVHVESDERILLDNLIRRNLSRCSYASIKGMAISQIKDMEKRKNVRDPLKSKMSALRTLMFGYFLLSDGRLYYDAKNIITGNMSVDNMLNKLRNAYDNSPFPDTVNDYRFRELLYNIRIKNLDGYFQ